MFHWAIFCCHVLRGKGLLLDEYFILSQHLKWGLQIPITYIKLLICWVYYRKNLFTEKVRGWLISFLLSSWHFRLYKFLDFWIWEFCLKSKCHLYSFSSSFSALSLLKVCYIYFSSMRKHRQSNFADCSNWGALSSYTHPWCFPSLRPRLRLLHPHPTL